MARRERRVLTFLTSQKREETFPTPGQQRLLCPTAALFLTASELTSLDIDFRGSEEQGILSTSTTRRPLF